MGDASGSEASPVRPERARPVWVRRCLSCDRDDVSSAFGTLVPGASLVSLSARAPRARVRQRQPMSRCGPGMTPATMAVTPVPARFTHGLPVRVRIRHQGHTQRKMAHRVGWRGAAIPAWVFRAVASAHEQTDRGMRLTFMGLPEGVEPAVGQ